MKVVTKSLRMVNVAAYLTSLNKAFLGVNDKTYETNYLPVIQQFDINPTAGIKFCYYEVKKGLNSDSAIIQTNVSKDIEDYDPNNSRKNLHINVRKENKFIIEKGGLSLGPALIVANFTTEPITVYDHLNGSTVFHPVEQNRLTKAFEGKIIVFAIHRITTPTNHSRATGVSGNYLKDYLDHHKFNPSEMDKLPGDKFHQSLKLRYFVSQAWDSFIEKNEDTDVPEIKAITMGVLTPRMFIDDTTEEEVSVFFRDLDLYFTKSKNFVPIINPACSRSSDFAELKENVVPGSPCIFMVDPDNEMKPRYYSLHNKVHMVPKIKSKSRERGLWIGKFDKNFDVVEAYHIPVNEINTVDFLFEHQDEARDACNLREKRERDLKDREASFRERENELKLERAQFEHDSKIKLRKMEEEHAAFKHKLEQESLNSKAAYDWSSNSMKQHFDERKYARDDIRHERDSSLETLKTVAAVAGVVATGFVIIKQLGKAQ